MEEEKPLEKPLPRNIRGGFVVLMVACVMFFLDAVLQMVAMVDTLAQNQVVWTSTTSVISFLKHPTLFLFFVLGGISGISFARRKKFLAGWVGLFAILCFFFFAFDFFDSVLKLIKTSDWSRFFGSFLSVQIDTTLYFIGWFVSKDYFED